MKKNILKIISVFAASLALGCANKIGPKGDFNQFDDTDTRGFASCMHGPNTICQRFDFDADNDVDLADFAIYQQRIISKLDFDPTGERIMQLYLNPLDRRGYDSLALIPTMNDEFTAIGLHGWSWHRYPNQFDDPEIQQAIADIKAKGFKLVIGRDLWPRWIPQDEKDSWATSRAMPFDDRWIQEQLEASVAEKKKYGAWATYVDAEPYGQNRTTDDGSERPFEGSRHMLKAHERTHGWELAMTIHERRVFADTLRRVRESTGLSWDFVYPSSSGRSDGYPWACREIGKYPCNSKCFYLKNITDKIPMGSASGYPQTVDIWYSAATIPSADWGAGSLTLTADDLRVLWSRFEQGKVLYPELKGFMVFSGTVTQKVILQAFQQPPG